MSDSTNEVPPDQKLWQDTTEELVKKYQTNAEDGISDQEAEKRLAKDGYNELTAKKKSKLLQFLLQFNNSIIYILIAAAAITLFMHHYSDSAVIGIVIIANAFIGFFQEMQADNALSKIRELLVSQTTLFVMVTRLKCLHVNWLWVIWLIWKPGMRFPLT